MDVPFLMSIFRLFPGFKMSFEHNSVRKNLFLSPCFCWDSRLSSREMEQKLKLGGLIGYGNSYLDSVFRYSKVLRLHPILHDAAGAVRAHSGKGPGCCYMIGQGPNSCLLDHVTGLLFCLYIKLVLPSIFNSVDFSQYDLHFFINTELADKNVIRELGLFIDGSVQRFSFCSSKSFKPNKQTTWNTSHLYGIACSIGKPDYDKLFPDFYDIKVMNADVFAKGLEKCRLLIKLPGQSVENFVD